MPDEDLNQENAPVETATPTETETQSTETQPVDNSQETDNSINPAWNDVLSKLPEEFHSQIVPTFKEWDGNFSKVQSKFAPYKEFAEKGVDANQLKTAMSLAQAMEANPRGVWEALNSRFNFAAALQEQGQGEELEDEEEEETEETQFDITQHPQFQQMQNQLQMMEQTFSQQREKEIEAKVQREIEQTWTQLEAKHGNKLDNESRNDIIAFAFQLAGQNEAPDLNKGYERYMNTISRARNSSANNNAPDVLSGNGPVPAAKGYDFTNPDDIERYLKDNGVGQ